jgi:alkylation response protein AidB-like acyl-CoA dehydrogenase
VDLGLSEEQQLLRESARDFLERECPIALVRGQMDPDAEFPKALWDQMVELGWIGLIVPEEHGGSGLGFVDAAVLLEELGRVLCPAPFLSTAIIGAVALQSAADEAHKRDWLARLVGGELRLALAQAEADVDWDCRGIQMQAPFEAGEYRLSGRKFFVADAVSSSHLIVPIRSTPSPEDPTRGITLLLVETRDPGVSIRPIDWNEETRAIAEVEFKDLRIPEAARLGEHGEGWPVLGRIHDAARVGICAEACGGADRVLEDSVEYAKTREQFGQPIGRFQALQHRCADMLIRSQAIRSATYYAAWTLAEGEPDAHRASCLAKAFCSEAYVEIAGSAIQIHGGLGFTWEQDLHLYFKHARAAELALGSPAFQRELAVRELIDA